MTEDHRRHSRRTPAPRGLKLFNTVVLLLLRLGVPLGPMRVLTVPGRKSGLPRRTPVTPVPVGGRRYIVQAFPQADWVRNVRAAGSGRLGRGRRQPLVRLVELDSGERAPVLSELPRLSARAASIYVRNGIVDAPTPEAFAAAADRSVVFRIDEQPPVKE
jgi:deazaflavin-dependent oxidoreductase (nitroreductase family)